MFYLELFLLALAIVATNFYFERRGWKRGYARGKTDALDVGKKTLEEVTRSQSETWKAYADSLCDKHRKAAEENSREWAAFAEREYKRGLGEFEAYGKRQRELGYEAGVAEGCRQSREALKKPSARKGSILRAAKTKAAKKTAKAKK